MYRYDEFDAKMVRERAEQFRYQVERRIRRLRIVIDVAARKVGNPVPVVPIKNLPVDQTVRGQHLWNGRCHGR